MTGSPGVAPTAAGTRRRQAGVMAGLLATLLGIALLSLTIPVGAGELARGVAVVGSGALLLWVGGILLGNVSRPFWRGRGR